MTIKPIKQIKLHVIIRNPAPFFFMQEPVKHREVEIKLTPEQMRQIELKYCGTDRGVKIFEDVSMCFLELEEV